MTTYTLISAMIFLAFGISWKKSDVVNLLIKLSFIGMGLVGFFLWAQAMGYIVKISG